MTSAAPRTRTSAPPTRRLRLLAALWLPASVLVGLAALGAAGTAVRSIPALVAPTPGTPVAVGLVGVLVGGLAAVVLGRIAWRLAVEVPRTVRAWDEALDERRRTLLG